MTFEEFFTKKKIDLAALKAAEPTLFEEFKLHFSVMGEKSFDHSKKFWFNRLRKLYKSTAAEVPTIKKEKIIEQPALIKEVHNTEDSKEISTAKPAGFKPRFKVGLTKPVASEVNADENSDEKIAEKPADTPVDTPAPTAPKPAGFKPRFKAGITKPVTSEVNADENSDEKIADTPADTPADIPAPTAPKPTGFKPRFKAGITNNIKPKD